MKNAVSAFRFVHFSVIAITLAFTGCAQESTSDSGARNDASVIRNAPDTDGGTWGYLGGLSLIHI